MILRGQGHGGGLFIDGRAGATRVDGVWGGIKWTMESVLFYRNNAGSSGGGASVFNIWPLTSLHNDCDWIENTAGFVSGAHRDAWWPTVNLGEVLPFGFGSSTYVNSHYQGFPDRDSALLGACWDCTVVILSLCCRAFCLANLKRSLFQTSRTRCPLTPPSIT